MSTELEKVEGGSAELEATKEQIRLIAGTEFVPKDLRGNPHAILAIIMYGKEVGLGPMESLAEISMVNGRPGLSAKAMVKLARRAGHSITGESSATKAIVKGKRADNDDEWTVTFTMDDAKRAKLAGKAVWQMYPDDMLYARAVSKVCRRLFPDVVGSLAYTPEELVDVDVETPLPEDEGPDDTLEVEA